MRLPEARAVLEVGPVSASDRDLEHRAQALEDRVPERVVHHRRLRLVVRNVPLRAEGAVGSSSIPRPRKAR